MCFITVDSLHAVSLLLNCLSLFFLSFYSRLKEIDMSEYDAATYERFSNAVRRQVQSLRIILDTLQVSSLQTGSLTL